MNYRQPQRDINTGGSGGDIKPKRKRKDWVYKEDYDRLQFKYNLLKWSAVALVVGLLFVIKFA